MEKRECTFEGCGRELKACGLCISHYRQMKRTGKVVPIRTMSEIMRDRYGKNHLKGKGKKCKREECTNRARSKGLCVKHYAQWRRAERAKGLKVTRLAKKVERMQKVLAAWNRFTEDKPMGCKENNDRLEELRRWGASFLK